MRKLFEKIASIFKKKPATHDEWITYVVETEANWYPDQSF